MFGKIQPGKNPLVKFPQENCQLEIYPLGKLTPKGNFPGEYFVGDLMLELVIKLIKTIKTN